jgi:hypothetical protein
MTKLLSTCFSTAWSIERFGLKPSEEVLLAAGGATLAPGHGRRELVVVCKKVNPEKALKSVQLPGYSCCLAHLASKERIRLQKRVALTSNSSRHCFHGVRSLV